MALRNVSYIRVKDMTTEQKKELSIDENAKTGLVAIETRNAIYHTVAVPIKKGMVNYILNGN